MNHDIHEVKDDSIIDVTADNFVVGANNPLQDLIHVPKWSHHYVYSFSEINSASSEQKAFYKIFKKSFLKDQYWDLEGNINYAFILLFDLLIDVETHKDMIKLEKQLKVLGKCYPKTRSYGITFLMQKMEAKGDRNGVARLQSRQRFIAQSSYVDPDHWKLGTKYKSRLNLNSEEVELLNKLWNYQNNFSAIEYCYIEILKLYIISIAALKQAYQQDGTNLNEQFLNVSDVIARLHYRYRTGSNNYKYSLESTSKDFYVDIFKLCENAVREHYGHKRKINTESYFTPIAKAEYEKVIVSKVTKILQVAVLQVNPPDEATEIELYSQNTNRWKIKFEQLCGNFTNNAEQFEKDIVLLGHLNQKNPAVENIFFEASKFISKYNKEAALKFYIYYIYHDLQSVVFNNKQLARTIQKNLFKTNEQIDDFGKIVSDLINDRKLKKALTAVSEIYTVKRKKIQLDLTSIQRVQEKHSGTVELLNEYLQDDEINESDDTEIQVLPQSNLIEASIYLAEIPFTTVHLSLLNIFSKNNFSVLQLDIEAFAKSNGLFKNPMIESINDVCYEALDDLLIEEEDEYYTLNPDYYHQILI